MIDTKELRRLAQAATPGPWKVGQYLGSPRQFVIHMDVGDKGRGSDVAFTSANFGNDETIANARLIAAANPAAVSELLDRLEAAEKAVTEAYQRGYETGQEEIAAERDNVAQQLVQSEIGKREISEAHDAVTGRLSDLADENTALRAKVNEMEQQEPIGEMLEVSPHNYELRWYRPVPFGAKLYTLPGAKEQEPTSDWWDCLIADISAIDCMYRGSPTYAHDAYWMREHVVRMLEQRRDALPGAKGEDK